MKKYIIIMSFLLLLRYFSSANDVVGYNYWFDSNSDNPILIETTDNSVSLDVMNDIDKSELLPGIHFFYMQIKYVDDSWSEILSRFLIIPLPERPAPWTHPNNKITKWEYWIDGKYSERIIPNIETPSSEYNIIADVDVSKLTPGVHFLKARFMDEEGQWNSVQNNFFIIPFPERSAPWTHPNNKITKCEYWFDGKYSERIIPNIETPSSEYNIIADVDVSKLTPGVHFLKARFMDEEGQWNSVQNNFFIIPFPERSAPWTHPNNKITKCEYWFDGKYSERIIPNIETPSSEYNIIADVDVSKLTPGVHFLKARFMDEAGQWNSVQNNFFVIKLNARIEITYPNNKIISYKYWYDDNTAGTEIVTLEQPVNPYELNTAFTVPHFSEGTTHSFNIQFKDLEGMWSSVITTEFTFNNSIPVADAGASDINVYLGQSVELTGSATDPNNDQITEYEWVIVNAPVGSTLSGTIANTADWNFTPDVVGDYQLSFRASDGTTWSEADLVTVHVAENQVPVVLITSDVNTGKAPLTVNFDGSQCSDPENVQLQYEWDFGDGSPVSNEMSPTHVFDTPGVYTVTVKVSDGFNQPVESNITITVLIPNNPPVATCKDVTANTDINQCTANASIDNGSSDPDADVITITQEPPGPYPLGNSTVSLTVTDEHGLSSSCNANVTVIDNSAPIVITKNPTVTLLDGLASITIDDVDNGSNDNCGIAEMSLNKSSFNCSDGGKTVDVILTVTDVNGNTATGTASVTVIGEIPPIGISVYPPYTVPGEGKNTIYLGFGYQSVTLTASGGTIYSWISDPPGFTSNVANPTVSPTDTTTYTVTVTNDYGCTGTMSLTVIVVDWRCGNGEHKVKICHNNKTICIDTHAVQEHLNHGDHLGDCRPNNGQDNRDLNPDTSNYQLQGISVMLKQNNPNPFSTTTEIQYFVSQQAYATIVLTDMEGREIARLIDMTVKAGWSTLILNGSDLSAGTYYLRLESMGKVGILGITKY